jgi:hypothetical protein
MNSPRRFPLSHTILFCTIIFLFFLLLIEVFLRWYIPANLATNTSAIFALDPVLGWTIEPNQELCYIGGDGRFCYKRSNRFGTLGENFISPRPKNVFRVLVTGDSHIHSTVSESRTITAQLQRLLNRKLEQPVEVINAGVGGYSPYQQFLRALFLLNVVEPDVIIWGFYSGNDLSNLEFGDGPFIDDEFNGWVSPIPNERKLNTYQMPADVSHAGFIGWLQRRSRLLDLLDFAFHYNSWDPKPSQLHQRMKQGPFRRVSLDRIRELFPTLEAYQAMSSWYAQGASQRQYFSLHPNRIEPAYQKLRVLTAAFTRLAERSHAQMIILNIPSFLQSPDVQTRQYEELESALDIIHMRTMERELSLRFQDWCELSGIDYIDGLAVLQNAPEQRSTWYERTAHIDAKTQYLLAEALGEPIINREQNRKSNPLRYHPPVSLYDILPDNAKEFVRNPWAQHPGWNLPGETIADATYAELVEICALPSPGPWHAGTRWKLKTTPDQEIYITFWKFNEKGFRQRIARYPFTIPTSSSKTAHTGTLEITHWSRQDPLSIQPIPNLPDLVSMETTDLEPLSPVYEIPWLRR